ncbi:helix-turn-helix domain-containing protein [Alkalicoccobacillus plakortidis]|uniref:Helix-turn-helix transcriptional regulator n=1 Tax=Alkalicoccobacillus plakortidis TaxID=444060 RepID=A0ABT0XPG6_9BACI|nr:helix-turn-helix transcriptional regulator [Alkalicoccobacillus plakortidis]MCM2677144.1 helix-turn-helix transcriptional regulator [Alkalicoccobacillus plakortidis]
MEFGPIIKYYRLKSGITQAELADGICSIPHLSKIENNAYSVNKETASMLMERLGLDINDEVERYGILTEQLEEFSDAIFYYDFERSNQLRTLIESEEDYYNRTNLVNLYHIYLGRYYLQKNKNDIGNEHIKIIEKNRTNLSPLEDLLYQNLIGVYLAVEGKTHESINHFLRLKANSNNVTVQELSYNLALNFTKLGQYEKSIPYAQEALQLFKDRNNYIRIIHIQMILAINYENMHLFEESKNVYRNLLRNARLLNQTDIYYKLLHNFALLLKSNNIYSKASEYLKECVVYYKNLPDLKEKNEDLLITLTALVEVLLEMNSKDEEIELYLEEIEYYIEKSSSKLNKLQAKKLKFGFENSEKYYAFLDKEYIPYLQKNDMYSYSKPALLEMAKWHSENNRSQLSNKFYQQYIELY